MTKTATYTATLNKLAGCASKNTVLIVITGCPHCEAAVRYLTSGGVPFTVIPKTSLSDKIIEAMGEAIGQTSFPRVFVGGAFVGGNVELQKIPVSVIRKKCVAQG